MSEFTSVNCKIPNGVVLRTFEKSEGPFGVISYLPKESVTLNGGVNKVDRKFFAAWLKSNSDLDIVKNNFIEEI